MKTTLVILGLLAGLFISGWLLLGCPAADDSAARRANAQADAARARAELERAAGEADAQRTRAEADAAGALAIQERESNRLAHQQFLQTVPVLLIIAGGIVLVIVAALIAWDVYQHRPAWQATRPSPPAITNIWLLQPPTSDQGRAAYWRQIEITAHDRLEKAP